MTNGERSLAVFIDFENLALGFQGRREKFDISRVIERLVEKGKIVAKKAYADWSRFAQYTSPLHEAAIELIEIPRRAQSGKNSADIRLCVDAMDLAYSKEHINTFVVVSGDSDFSPLVSKLKELGKHVIGLGMQESTSDLLRDNCDEFIYYEDLNRPGVTPELTPEVSSHLPENKRKAFALLLESLLALRRENKEVLWSSMIKDTMKRKKPSFNEAYHGYRTFSELLEDAQKEGLLELEIDKRSRTYVVTRFGSEAKPEAAPSAKKKRRRRSKKKGSEAASADGTAQASSKSPALRDPTSSDAESVVIEAPLAPPREEAPPAPPVEAPPEPPSARIEEEIPPPPARIEAAPPAPPAEDEVLPEITFSGQRRARSGRSRPPIRRAEETPPAAEESSAARTLASPPPAAPADSTDIPPE